MSGAGWSTQQVKRSNPVTILVIAPSARCISTDRFVCDFRCVDFMVQEESGQRRIGHATPSRYGLKANREAQASRKAACTSRLQRAEVGEVDGVEACPPAVDALLVLCAVAIRHEQSTLAEHIEHTGFVEVSSDEHVERPGFD